MATNRQPVYPVHLCRSAEYCIWIRCVLPDDLARTELLVGYAGVKCVGSTI